MSSGTHRPARGTPVCRANPSPVPELRTQRLRLRPLGFEHLDDLVRLNADPEVRRYVDEPLAPTHADVAQWLARRTAGGGPGADPPFWAAYRHDDAFVGWFHLREEEGDPHALDLGYRLIRSAWGCGYATEGAQALVRRAFAVHGAQRVVAHALGANAASLRVLGKAGLRPVSEYLHRGELPAVRLEAEPPSDVFGTPLPPTGTAAS